MSDAPLTQRGGSAGSDGHGTRPGPPAVNLVRVFVLWLSGPFCGRAFLRLLSAALLRACLPVAGPASRRSPPRAERAPAPLRSAGRAARSLRSSDASRNRARGSPAAREGQAGGTRTRGHGGARGEEGTLAREGSGDMRETREGRYGEAGRAGTMLKGWRGARARC